MGYEVGDFDERTYRLCICWYWYNISTSCILQLNLLIN